MGRTLRLRKKKLIFEYNDYKKIINLQKALKLKCPKTQISYFDDTGWGVRCKKKIDEGEILIALPLHHLITVNVQSEIFYILNSKNEVPQFVLSIFLIYESHLKEKSRYFEYIESLPKSFVNPYFCLDNEMNLLPPFIRKDVSDQKILVENVIEKLHNVTNDKSCSHCGKSLKNIFSREKIIWAWFIVNTRCVYYEDEKLLKSLALAPFLDLFNHSDDAVTKMLIDFESGHYILKTYKSYKKFDQVFIKYGAHSNLKLFIDYGFILPRNLNDYVEFSFDEILNSVVDFDSSLGRISKSKYNFIISNRLNKNLTKSEEFSWNVNGLIYVLITKDQNLSLLQSKIYSASFTSAEINAIEKISKIAAEKKLEELKQSLTKMETIENCTLSFLMAKNLLKIYLNLLQQFLQTDCRQKKIKEKLNIKI